MGLKTLFELIDKIKEIARPYKVKASRNCLGMYKNENPLFWRATVREDYQYLGEGTRFILEVSIKPLDFDNLRFTIIDPGENVKYTDLVRANRGFAMYTFFEKSYIVADDEQKLIQEIATQIFFDAYNAVSDFLENVKEEYVDLHHYIISKRNEEPELAGLSYIVLGEYQRAIECFDFAEKENKYCYLCYGTLDRYFHDVCRDYCTILLDGKKWEKIYVYKGISK